MSGVNFDGREIRKGAVDAIEKYVNGNGKQTSPNLREIVERIANAGGTPLVVADNFKPLGVIYFKGYRKERNERTF